VLIGGFETADSMKGFDRGLCTALAVVNKTPVIRPKEAHAHDPDMFPGLRLAFRVKIQFPIHGEILAHDQFTAKDKRGVPGPGQAEILHGSVPVRRLRVTARRVACSRLACSHPGRGRVLASIPCPVMVGLASRPARIPVTTCPTATGRA